MLRASLFEPADACKFASTACGNIVGDPLAELNGLQNGSVREADVTPQLRISVGSTSPTVAPSENVEAGYLSLLPAPKQKCAVWKEGSSKHVA